MIIDFHSHIGATVEKDEDDLLRSLDEARIDKAVIYAGLSMKLTNQELIKVIDRHPDRFLGALHADPAYHVNECNGVYNGSYVEQFSDCLDHPGIIGAKFYCGYEYFYPNDSVGAKFLLGVLNSRKRVAIFHCGDTYTVLNKAKLKYAQPLHIDEVAVDHPELKIVIAHMGYPWHRDTAEILYKNPNVYMDVSGFVYGSFKPKDEKNFLQVLEEVKMIYDNNYERVLFGTDWPISNQQSYRYTLINNGLFPTLSSNTEKLIKDILV